MAVAPSAFALPSSGGTVSPAAAAQVAYVNGTWLAASNGDATNQPKVRYATDPTGTWSTATALPAAPTGYEDNRTIIGSPMYADGNYIIAVRYQKTGALAFDSFRYRLYYASSLSGSWSTVDPGMNDYCFWQWCTYINGEFVLAGMDLYTVSGGDPWPWIMASASTVTGSWTKTTGSTSGLSGITQDRIPCVIFSNGTYYRILERGPGNPSGGGNPFDAWVQESTSLTGTWTSSTALPTDFTKGVLLKVGDQLSVVMTDGSIRYSSDLTGSWSTATLPSGMTHAAWVGYGATWYVVTGYGASFAPKVGYGSSLTSLDVATHSLTVDAYRGGYGANYFVIGDGFGRLNYSFAEGDPIAPTLLRQRQSPRRAPSRISSSVPNLRARQTPFIT